MAFYLSTSLLLLIIGTLSVDVGTSPAIISKRPISLLLEFFETENAQKQKMNHATISLITDKKSGLERKISGTQKSETLKNLFYDLYQRMANRSGGKNVIDPIKNPESYEVFATAVGFASANVEDEDVKKMANFATDTISRSSNYGHLKLVKITEAKTQIVAGKNYKMNLELASIALRNKIYVYNTSIDLTYNCEVLVFDQPWTKTRQLSKFQCSSALPSKVVAEVIKALVGRKELSQVFKYLTMSEEEFARQLPSSEEGYTFFAPTNMAFVKMLPQDVVDPFFVDSQLRTNLLLHHFSLYKRTADELFEASKKDAMSLSMALNGRFVDLSYSGEPESPVKVNGGNIILKPIQLGSNLGVIYIVDTLFTTRKEIKKALRGNPVLETPWGPISLEPSSNNKEDDESESDVVVDVVKELSQKENAEVPIAGNLKPANVEDADVKEMAEFATTALSKSIKAARPLTLINIVKAGKQIVAGINYKLQLELKDEQRKNDVFVCDVVVFESFTSTRQLISSDCKPFLTFVHPIEITAESPDNTPTITPTVVPVETAAQSPDKTPDNNEDLSLIELSLGELDTADSDAEEIFLNIATSLQST